MEKSRFHANPTLWRSDKFPSEVIFKPLVSALPFVKTNMSNPREPIYEYTDKETILYNISVGAKVDELKYTYENDPDFQVVPTFGAIPTFNSDEAWESFARYLKNYQLHNLLHGEHYLKVHKFPVPTEATVKTKFHPIEVTQKKTNTIIVHLIKSEDESGNLLFENEATYFIRNCEGETKKYGERHEFAKQPFAAPKEEPQFVAEQKLTEEQAVLYRLTGDRNPLHVDPKNAKNAKFEKPILHGLCTLGVSVKLLLDKYGGFDEIKARFTGIVYPGETLRVTAWKQGDLVLFEAHVIERGTKVISNAALKLVGDKANL